MTRDGVLAKIDVGFIVCNQDLSGCVYGGGYGTSYPAGGGGISFTGSVDQAQVAGKAVIGYIRGIDASGASAYDSSSNFTLVGGLASNPTLGFGGGSPSMPCLQCVLRHINYTKWPADASTGNFWHTFDDLAVAGRGPPLSLTRTYNSQNNSTNDGFGLGWSSSLTMHLVDSGTSVIVTEEGGSKLYFGEYNGEIQDPTSGNVDLVHNGDGTWTFTRAQKTRFTFDSSGRLTGSHDLNGEGYQVTRPSSTSVVATNTSGRSLTLTLSGGLVVSATDSSGRTATFSYTGQDLIASTDIAGGVTQMTYTDHRMITMLDPAQFGAVSPTPITNHYDNSGRIDWQSDYLGQVTNFDYATAPNGTIITDPIGNKTLDTFTNGELSTETQGYGTAAAATTTYAINGSTLALDSVTDPRGNTTTYLRDAFGRVTQRTDPDGHIEYWSYGPVGELDTYEDQNNELTTYTNDQVGNRLTQSTPATGNKTARFTYGHGDSTHPGDVTSITDPDGKVWSFTYNSDGSIVRTTDPLGNTTLRCFDALGRVSATIAPKGTANSVTCDSASPSAYTEYRAYDSLGSITSITDAAGNTTTSTYDADQRLKTRTDGRGDTTQYSYDLDGELLATTAADGSSLKSAYWPDGTVKSHIARNGAVTTYTYDPIGRLSSVTDPMGRVTSYEHDLDGNQTKMLAPGGLQTLKAYDNENRLSATSYSDGVTASVSYTYDAKGQRLTMTDGSGTTQWTWDVLGRITQVTNGHGQTTKYGYNLRGETTSITYPNNTGTVTYGIDDAGHTSSATDWLGKTTTFHYDADSNIDTISSPNGVTTTRTFDSADRLQSIAYTKGSIALGTLTYARNPVDQITTITPSAGAPGAAVAVTYSTNGRLTSADGTGTQITYDSDLRISKTTDGGQLAYDAADQLTTLTPPTGAQTTFGYDATGDRVSSQVTGASGATQYTYDQPGELTRSTTPTGSSTTYTYDGTGLRTSKTPPGGATQYMAWDERGVFNLLSDGSLTFIYGPEGIPIEQVNGSTPLYIQTDQLGSTTLLTDSTGAVTGTYAYSVFGLVRTHTGTASSPILFAGQYQDTETGLYYMRARYYDPLTAQFLSRDRLAFQTRDLYGYATEDPLNRSDPLGLNPADPSTWTPRTWVTVGAVALAIGSVLTLQPEGLGALASLILPNGMAVSTMTAASAAGPVVMLSGGIALIGGGAMAYQTGSCPGWFECAVQTLQTGLDAVSFGEFGGEGPLSGYEVERIPQDLGGDANDWLGVECR